MLTPDQINHFNVFGLLILKQTLTDLEIKELSHQAYKIWEQKLGHEPAENEHISIAPFLELNPKLTSLIEDDRIYHPMIQLLGKDMIWMRSEGVHGTMTKTSSHHWHADRPGTRELSFHRIKIMIYLDPMRKESGSLRVIPGSHRSPFHESLLPFQERHGLVDPIFFGAPGNEVPCQAVETDPGDVVIFNQSLYHAVYGKTGRRRYISLKYAARPLQDDHLASIKEFSPDAFKPHEQIVESDSPRLQAMTTGLNELRIRAENL